MACSPEQLAANRRNSALSSGPRTAEGKATSRRNGLKHGLSGEGIALPDEDAQQVEMMASSFRRSFQPGNDQDEVMVRRLAVMAVRMERCVEYETATLSIKVREAMNDPSHETEAERREAIALAKFDHSPESASVRRYEAAASREFFKTLRLLKTREPADEPAAPPRMVEPIPAPASTSDKLASSCPPASQPTPSYVDMARSLVAPHDCGLTEDDVALVGLLSEWSSPSNPLNFAIGKAPGSPR